MLESRITDTRKPDTVRRISGVGLSLQHLVDSVSPSRPATHLLQRVLLRLLFVHPTGLHSRRDHVLIQLLKGQELSLHIGTMNAVGIVEILSPMLLARSQRSTATLTLHRKGHRLTQRNKSHKH